MVLVFAVQYCVVSDQRSRVFIILVQAPLARPHRLACAFCDANLSWYARRCACISTFDTLHPDYHKSSRCLHRWLTWQVWPLHYQQSKHSVCFGDQIALPSAECGCGVAASAVPAGAANLVDAALQVPPLETLRSCFLSSTRCSSGCYHAPCHATCHQPATVVAIGKQAYTQSACCGHQIPGMISKAHSNGLEAAFRSATLHQERGAGHLASSMSR
jgi:hypothetical protein